RSGLDPNLSNKLSWTPLMLAAIEGNTEIARVLVSCGANVDATNSFGESALSLAAHKGHVLFVNWLVNIGANRHCRPHGRKSRRLAERSVRLAATSDIRSPRTAARYPDVPLSDQTTAIQMPNPIIIETDLFEHREVKPHFINPCCFGEDFAAW